MFCFSKRHSYSMMTYIIKGPHFGVLLRCSRAEIDESETLGCPAVERRPFSLRFARPTGRPAKGRGDLRGFGARRRGCDALRCFSWNVLLFGNFQMMTTWKLRSAGGRAGDRMPSFHLFS